MTGHEVDTGTRNGGRGVLMNRQLSKRRNFVRTNAMNPKVAAVDGDR